MSLFYDRGEYIEMHGLEWDIMHSPCGDCPHVNDCQKQYYGCKNEEVSQ